MSDQTSLAATHLDFVSLQVRDLQAAHRFYCSLLGFLPSPETRPDALVFQTQAGAIFAVRAPLVNLDTVSHLGWGVGLWFAHPNVDALYASLIAEKVSIARPIEDGPFGRMFTCIDPDGYALTLHQQR